MFTIYFFIKHVHEITFLERCHKYEKWDIVNKVAPTPAAFKAIKGMDTVIQFDIYFCFRNKKTNNKRLKALFTVEVFDLILTNEKYDHVHVCFN